MQQCDHVNLWLRVAKVDMQTEDPATIPNLTPGSEGPVYWNTKLNTLFVALRKIILMLMQMLDIVYCQIVQCDNALSHL